MLHPAKPPLPLWHGFASLKARLLNAKLHIGCLALIAALATHAQDATIKAAEVTQAQAVTIALQHSPALQALMASSEASQARAQANARPGLLRFSWARLRQGDEVEIDRSLSIGLLDVLTWPWRANAADKQVEVMRQQQALAALNHAQAVRAQWVQAVAAQQMQRYQEDILQAARTGATLAQRLQAAGHFSTAQAAQEALSAAQAQAASTRAQQQATSEREALIRLMGLTGDEARSLALPERLPDVPAQPTWQADQLTIAAAKGRLDTRLAQAQWQALQSDTTDQTLRSLVDIEGGFTRQTSTGQAAKQGPEFSFSLMAIDLGAARRRSARADEQAALAQWQQAALNAESQLRESWANYQASHQAARHAQEVLMPLRQRLLDERLKQYNGMLIGPLELLNEARSHTASVIDAMQAQQAFWLADLAVRAAIEGSTSPASTSASTTGGTQTAEPDRAAH